MPVCPIRPGGNVAEAVIHTPSSFPGAQLRT
jgi:hypothetical protein